MKKFLKKKLGNEKGMTLIELLAVIVILAIIAAIAIPAIGNIIENSRVGAMKSDTLNALAAADIYFADNPDEAGPVTLADLEDDYLDDVGTLQASISITQDGLVTGVAQVDADLNLEFTGADKAAISGTPNNTADATTLLAADHGGVGSVIVSR